MRAMKVCTYTNLGAASALFLVLGFRRLRRQQTRARYCTVGGTGCGTR